MSSFDFIIHISNPYLYDYSEPIAYYLWPNMVRSPAGLESVLLKPGPYFYDGVLTIDNYLLYAESGTNVRCTSKDGTFNVTNTGGVLFFGTYIVEHTVLLKGSNDKEDWSRFQADLDALFEYLYDCKSTGMNVTELQKIETKYALPYCWIR